jgi:DNA-binding NtrC family response regulator
MAAWLSEARIVVADDNENMRKIIATMLKAAGIGKVFSCENGYEAICTIHRQRPHLAIVDFNMAPVDGIEFTRFVRASPLSVNPNLPILMMTGHAERTRVLKATKAGVTEFIVKPLTAKRLLGRFDRILNSETFYRRASRAALEAEAAPDLAQVKELLQGPPPELDQENASPNGTTELSESWPMSAEPSQEMPERSHQ